MDTTPLKPFVESKPKTLPFYSGGGDVTIGQFGPTRFIITLNPDGHTEASLSRGSPLWRPTDSQIAAFFRLWGCQPLYEDPRAKRCRMFVMRDTRIKVY
ncbi:hypothetical protein AAFO90_16940 [Phaeobacter sp. CAU 1743]|uniref:hypothetical protein n=1 Tax=Phaeobacter sp. CAU 1743 TaxID=3140367 RepID=UPI00325BFE9B